MALSQAKKDWFTNTNDLTAVADAIRAKGGTQEGLVYPSGFVSAIQAIQTGVTPQLIITTTAGASVVATKGSTTVSGTAGTDGLCTLEIPEAGEWSVTVTLNSNSRTQTILIGTQSLYLPAFATTFADNDWADIISACQSGSVPSTWAVGDSKTMTINGKEYQIDIIGKDHDDYADGSGKAPLTFQMHVCYTTIYTMNSSNTNSGGWRGSRLRREDLPAILALMPQEVQDGIREVTKMSGIGGSTTVEAVTDKLFLLSEVEVFGSATYAPADEGTQYAYYSSGGEEVRKKTQNGYQMSWWERSPSKAGSSTFSMVGSSGNKTTSSPTTANGVPFAFCF